MSMQQLCTCFIDNHHFALPAEQVQEVVRRLPVSRMPLMPQGVAGLVNLRGQILIAIDLRERFGQGAMDVTTPKSHIVLSGRRFSLLVDRVGDVMGVDRHTFESTPANVDHRVSELITGAFKLEKHLMLLLDVEKMTASIETSAVQSKNKTIHQLTMSV